MFVKVLRREGVRGYKLIPGMVMDVPGYVVEEVRHRNPPVIEILEHEQPLGVDRVVNIGVPPLTSGALIIEKVDEEAKP